MTFTLHTISHGSLTLFMEIVGDVQNGTEAGHINIEHLDSVEVERMLCTK